MKEIEQHMINGCLPPKVDLRDYRIKAVQSAQEVVYPEEFCLPIYQKVKNQGQVNSCVAHASSSILEYYAKADQDKTVTLSTNFIYGIQNSECGQDGMGMYLADACKIIKKYGDMLESDCPNNTEIPKCWALAETAVQDSNKTGRAYEYRISSYYECSEVNDKKYALMNYGPILVSVKWYERYSFEGNVLHFDTTANYGYHASVIVGWNKDGFILQNSWGSDWGENGFYVLPFDCPPAQAKVFIDYPNGKKPDDSALIEVNTNKSLVYNIVLVIVNAIINLFKRKG